MNKLGIVRLREREPNEIGMTVTYRGGSADGQEFRQVEAEMTDGTKRWLWASNTTPVILKRVFVPWDFEHPELI